MFNKRRGRRKSSRAAVWFANLSKGKKIGLIVGVVVLLLVAFVGTYIAWAFSKLGKNEVNEEEVIVNEEVQKEDLGDGYTNFVLFGSDSRQGNVENDLNTDSIIIVSLNNETKEVKMVSVYRDTLMDLTNGSINKCNSAYARGGATQALSMLNMNLDLQLKKYVTIDFSIVVDIIDILGGIEVNVTEKEVEAMNKYIGETARVAGVEAVYLTEPGLQLLNGAQATTYARIRKGVGDDFARTERQRLVIQKVVEKAVTAGLGTINEMIETAFPRISTNFTMIEILKYAQWFAEYTFGETSGFPFEYGSDTIPGKGSCVYATDLTGDVTKLHEFLFGTVGYTPTSTVEEIESEVDSIVQSALYSAPTQNYSSSGSGSQSYEEPETPTTPETPATPEPSTPSTPTTPETPATDTPTTPENPNTGNTGSTDNSGSTGSTDNSGNTGSTDNSGNTGSTGTGGSTGNTGSTGNSGSTGESGNTGTTTPDTGASNQTTTQ